METYTIPVFGNWNGQVVLLARIEVTASSVREAMHRARLNAAYQYGFNDPFQVMPAYPAECC